MSYDKYLGKHFARVHGLLASCKNFVNSTKKPDIKYFTLCAKPAIDIFMLEKNNKLMKSFLKLFELQAKASSFVIAITLPLNNICAEYSAKFKESIIKNIDSHDSIKSKMENLHSINYDDLDENIVNALGFAKSI